MSHTEKNTEQDLKNVYRTTIVCDSDIVFALREIAVLKEKQDHCRYFLKALITTAIIEFIQKERNELVNKPNTTLTQFAALPEEKSLRVKHKNLNEAAPKGTPNNDVPTEYLYSSSLGKIIKPVVNVNPATVTNPTTTIHPNTVTPPYKNTVEDLFP